MTITVEAGISKSERINFEELSANIYEIAMKIGRELMVQILETRDQELMLFRDRKRYRCKGKQKTSVKTKLGEIEFERRVYDDLSVSEGVHYVHLLDEELGIEKIGVIAKDVCEKAAELVCEMPYRTAAKTITETTGLSISAQGVWNIVQQMGEQRAAQVERHAELASLKKGVGCVVTDILYEENDGVWLKLQGKDRKASGPSKEMKAGIAYDGVTWQNCKDGKKRGTLDCKVAHASFEPAKKFRKNKEGIVASRFNVGKVKTRVINGDGANWIQKQKGIECICVLDKFHRNKKLTECIKDKDFLQLAKSLLFAKEYDKLLTCIEAQINSTEDETDRECLKELLAYYSENKEALSCYYDRGKEIPATREPGVIHHARLGSMESNIFTLIGNRMKGRRCCWSIQGANNLAALLCLEHTTGFGHLFSGLEPLPGPDPDIDTVDTGKPISAARMPSTVGKGNECYSRATLPNVSWLRNITGYQPVSSLKF